MRLVCVVEAADRSIHYDLKTKFKGFGSREANDPQLSHEFTAYFKGILHDGLVRAVPGGPAWCRVEPLNALASGHVRRNRSDHFPPRRHAPGGCSIRTETAIVLTQNFCLSPMSKLSEEDKHSEFIEYILGKCTSLYAIGVAFSSDCACSFL